MASPNGVLAGRRGALSRAAFLLAAAMVVFLVPAGPAGAQCPGVTVTLDHSIEVFRVGDFDPSDTHFHPLIFTAQMCNNLSEPRQVKLGLVIDSDTQGVLGTGETMPFDLAPGVITINNRDLTEASGIYELEDYHVMPEADELEDLILQLGYLPEGTYCFHLTMEPAGDGPYDFEPITVEDCLTVTNPVNLELLQPGAPFGGACPYVLTAHPQFQWSSRASRWQIRIAMVEPGDGSGEDVMENVPVYEAELGPTDVFGGGATGIISWNYPSAGEDLIRGQSYGWQVIALVETSGGTEEYPSEVFCFQYWNPEDQGAEEILDVLSRIMPELLDLLGPGLEGLTPTGTILVDGREVDLATLEGIVNGIASGRLRILETRIE
jgi:hypothetical protein